MSRRVVAAASLRVYFVTDPDGPHSVEATVAAALRGGATMVQMRDKTASDEDLGALATRLAPLCRAYHVPLVVNDRVAVAARAPVDGVHVGQADAAASAARARLGPNAIVGLSATDAREAAAIDPTVVDYCGLGPVFFTATKSDATPPLGLDAFATARAACPVPVVAIGGITADNAPSVVRSGADGVAVVTEISRAPDPAVAATSLRAAVAQAIAGRG
ncbi:MAG: thiamine phosphate synthase [Myxococcota bacterium]